MLPKKRTVPTPAEIALRHAELKVMVTKKTAREHR